MTQTIQKNETALEASDPATSLRLTAMLAEYNHLASRCQNFTSPLYNLIPMVSAGSALFLLKDNASTAAWGMAGIIGITLILLWISYVHAQVCSITLRLATVEKEINGLVGTAEGSGLGWYSRTACGGIFATRGMVFGIIVSVLMAFAIDLVSFACLSSGMGGAFWLIFYVAAAHLFLVYGIYRTERKRRE